ncbi:MAG: hypothetical protein KKD08_10110, partial [Alphaproteobacteria bacterium]|nr:hypothetical protein [Alphaproteobacteria bacterium]
MKMGIRNQRSGQNYRQRLMNLRAKTWGYMMRIIRKIMGYGWLIGNVAAFAGCLPGVPGTPGTPPGGTTIELGGSTY